MTTLYIARRRQAVRQSSRSFTQHIAWAVVCLLLLSLFASLWVSMQSLQNQNDDLKRQLAAATAPPSTCKVIDTWQPNSVTKHSIVTPNGNREFLVHVPQNFKKDKYYPLVMVFPGRGATAMDAQASFGLDALPAIVVYPFPSTSKDGDTAWQSAPYSSDANDVAFTEGVLDKVQGELCIDKTRVYVVGMSIGGGFASLLSCKLPDRFAAYAIIGGAHYAPNNNCRPARAAPIISIHGDNDPIVPYDGSFARQLPSVFTWTQSRASAEKCSAPTTTHSAGQIEVTTWDKCRGNGVVQHVRIIGGGHAWGDISNDALWQFLSRFSL